jgi:formylglycine-generating enzyme required for sulfatase activity
LGDARDYARWLSRKTGADYRLPSEAEWEYAARAGTTTARFWGDDPDSACAHANVYDRTGKAEKAYDDWTHHNCRDGHAETAPVGSFQANRFGLHDVLGNVREWVEDCWNDSYGGAPADARVWTTKECTAPVVRGGSWRSRPSDLRSAVRGGRGLGTGGHNWQGLRVARTLR